MKKVLPIMSYTINFFGESIRYQIIVLDNQLHYKFIKEANKSNVNINELLFDLTFLNDIGFSHWNDLPTIEKGFGLIINKENIIEFRKNYKKISQIRAVELINSNTLFNDYNVIQPIFNQKKKQESNCFLILQYEKGLFKKYQTKGKLIISDLDFFVHTLQIKNSSIKLVTDIKSDQIPLTEKKANTIITSLLSFTL